MTANIPKVFRIPRPKYGQKHGYKHPKKRSRVLERGLKKRLMAREIAKQRWEDKTAEHALQPQPEPVDENGVPEEIKYQNDLRNAYRMEFYQREPMDPTELITDQKKGEEWYLNKMGKLNDYKTNRNKWKSFLNSMSLSKRVIGNIQSKIPNNQAPVTQFWNKQTVDWLSDNRWKELQRHGLHGRHMIHFFKQYDRRNTFREWPVHNEVIRTMNRAQNKQR